MDFLCLDLKLIIEVDGSEHFTPIGLINGGTRDEILGLDGYTILRFEKKVVYLELESVLAEIKNKIKELS